MLIWIEFRNLHSSAAGTEIQASPAASPTAKPSVTPTSVAPLADGPHDGLLVASANGKVTFNLVNRLLRDEALAKCQQDLGSIPADAVCRSYYFPRLEVDPRTLPVAKNSTVGYVIKVDRQGVLFGQLTGADLGKLTTLSKQYQQGRLFSFHTKNGVFLGGSQYPLGCKEVPGLIVDGSAEWMSKCVVQDALR
jgi:hypothetical protein